VAGVQRGDVWWADLEGETPVVVLSSTEAAELCAIRIVRPATAAEKRGFVVLSGEEAADVQARDRIIAASGPDIGGVGIEIEVGEPEGLPYAGAVRVALPRESRIFCTWLLALTPDHLIRPAGSLSAAKLRHLDNALRLAAIE
jgi:mRNA interferase MazF